MVIEMMPGITSVARTAYRYLYQWTTVEDRVGTATAWATEWYNQYAATNNAWAYSTGRWWLMNMDSGAFAYGVETWVVQAIDRWIVGTYGGETGDLHAHFPTVGAPWYLDGYQKFRVYLPIYEGNWDWPVSPVRGYVQMWEGGNAISGTDWTNIGNANGVWLEHAWEGAWVGDKGGGSIGLHFVGTTDRYQYDLWCIDYIDWYQTWRHDYQYNYNYIYQVTISHEEWRWTL